MGTHLIPREVSGEGRILYVFSAKGFIFALVGLGIGTIFHSMFSAMGANLVGWIILAIFTLIGWGIGQGKVPDSNANSFFRKVGGENIDAIIVRWFKFNKAKKIYVSKITKEKK